MASSRSTPCVFLRLAVFVLTLSPLTAQLFDSQNTDTTDDLVALVAAIAVITLGIILSIAVIIACMQIAKRLGYSEMEGLLMLIPGVNVFILFRWAFQESPTERKFRTERQGWMMLESAKPDHPLV